MYIKDYINEKKNMPLQCPNFHECGGEIDNYNLENVIDTAEIESMRNQIL